MRIQIVSDLHTEFGDFELPETDADVIILAGDIGVGMVGLEWIAQQNFDRPVIYVPGNHEFYHHDISLLDALKKQSPEGVYVLNDDMTIINGVRFLGTILWTDFELFGLADKYFCMQQARHGMADFNVIQNQGRVFSPEDSIALNRFSADWLRCMLAEKFSGPTVVVTHHLPSGLSVHPRYAGNMLTPAFASNLEYLMAGDRVALWVHGHSHDACDYEIHGTRVVCNPRGYAPDELTSGFRPDLTVTV